MQILIHIPKLEGILSRLIRTGDRGIEMLQVLREADAHLEGIHGSLSAAISDPRVSWIRSLVRGYRGVVFILVVDGWR